MKCKWFTTTILSAIRSTARSQKRGSLGRRRTIIDEVNQWGMSCPLGTQRLCGIGQRITSIIPTTRTEEIYSPITVLSRTVIDPMVKVALRAHFFYYWLILYNYCILGVF